jgi:hypothetical protein
VGTPDGTHSALPQDALQPVFSGNEPISVIEHEIRC